MFADGDNSIFPSNVLNVPPPPIALKPIADRRFFFFLSSYSLFYVHTFYFLELPDSECSANASAMEKAMYDDMISWFKSTNQSRPALKALTDLV